MSKRVAIKLNYKGFEVLQSRISMDIYKTEFYKKTTVLAVDRFKRKAAEIFRNLGGYGAIEQRVISREKGSKTVSIRAERERHQFSSITGTLVEHTGYIIRMSGTDTYKFNGKKARGHKVYTAGLRDHMKGIKSQARNLRKANKKTATELYVFSNAPHAIWVNESLGSGGTEKRGKDWFLHFNRAMQAAFYESFREVGINRIDMIHQ